MTEQVTIDNHYYPQGLIRGWGSPLFRIHKEGGVIGTVKSTKSVLYRKRIYENAQENIFGREVDDKVKKAVDLVNPFDLGSLIYLNTPEMVHHIFWLLTRTPHAQRAMESSFLEKSLLWNLVTHLGREEDDTTYTQRFLNTALYNTWGVPTNFVESLNFVVNQSDVPFVLPDSMPSFVVLSPRILAIYNHEQGRNCHVVYPDMDASMGRYNAQLLNACDSFVISASKEQLEDMVPLCVPRK